MNGIMWGNNGVTKHLQGKLVIPYQDHLAEIHSLPWCVLGRQCGEQLDLSCSAHWQMVSGSARGRLPSCLLANLFPVLLVPTFFISTVATVGTTVALATAAVALAAGLAPAASGLTTTAAGALPEAAGALDQP